ncbi:TRAP transporter substrate-binding protein [Lutibaculum baratangense]|uniref:TRAP-type C4-dicarboxylate transport system, periplasmic component n=1 Tax=Lutibaculum baratangense AMV1 TaxID=631454 RepID=V4RHH6_9HYPH|nr:TRAP transporter substrate-binding protein [Lutibaculum baratangense]ESR24804.1 TRAP transporter solute receptor, unknown substrate 6 [Lutibaculum baratangense AMV1]
MDRRSFLKNAGLAGGVAAASTLASPAISQNRQEWRMVTTWPKNFPGLGVGAQRMADRITAASDGRLTVRLFSAGELVPALQSLDAVIDGSAEMSHGAAYYWQNKNVGLNFFTGVPYGMTAGELSAWVRHLGGQEIWDEIYAQFGLKGFLSGNTGTQAGGWFRSELNSVADIQGLRFRTPGLGGRVWEKMGATVTNLAAGEIFQALQSGTLDAAEFVGPYNDLALGFYQIAKNYYFPSFIEPGLATELVVDKAKYEALPTDLQEIVRSVAQAEYEMVWSDFTANDPRALQTLVNDHGVKVLAFPEDIMEAGAKASMEIFEELRASDDPLTKKVAESFVEGLALVRQKTSDADEPFLRAREKYFQLS